MKVNEIFYSIQGEGRNAGKAMVFVRLTGCNLRCQFCDTSYAFENGTEMTEEEIVEAVCTYPAEWVCITGGEPFLQDLQKLVNSIKLKDLKVHIETNGTIFQPIEADWLVVSPKDELPPNDLILARAHEMKVVIDSVAKLHKLTEYENRSTHLSVQPEGNKQDLVQACIEFVKDNPMWHLSLQVHKLIGIR